MKIETKFNLGDKVYYFGEFARGNKKPHKITEIKITIEKSPFSPNITYQLDNDNFFSPQTEFEIFGYDEVKERSLKWHKECIGKINKGKKK